MWSAGLCTSGPAHKVAAMSFSFFCPIAGGLRMRVMAYADRLAVALFAHRFFCNFEVAARSLPA